MSDDEKKSGDHHHHPGHHHHHHGHQQQQQYGTFEGGPASYYPPQQQQPAVGFPQPVPPPGSVASPGHPSAGPTYYAHGYQAVAGYVTVDGMPVRHQRLPCCGMGCGWFMFIIGFFFGAIPWYVAAFILMCSRVDYNEKPGYIACTIAAVVATIAAMFGATELFDVWD